ncbi:tachykinin-4 isoform X2 [Symphalangus syndactylus]|uniref:tachykinin-4 isoform X2 n=1 Tax=Symphalangus syndactylus TaxID=9590 RepID=UPI003006EB67
MLPCLALLLLMELSVCTVAGDGGEEQTLSTEAETWITEGAGPSIQQQLQEVKTGKASQFFGLMGKRVGGRPLIQPRRKKGREDEAQGSE